MHPSFVTNLRKEELHISPYNLAKSIPAVLSVGPQLLVDHWFITRLIGFQCIAHSLHHPMVGETWPELGLKPSVAAFFWKQEARAARAARAATKSSKLGRKVPMAAMAPKSTAKSLGATMHPWLLWLGTPNFLKNAGLRRVDTGGEAMPAMPHGFAFVMCASRIF